MLASASRFHHQSYKDSDEDNGVLPQFSTENNPRYAPVPLYDLFGNKGKDFSYSGKKCKTWFFHKPILQEGGVIVDKIQVCKPIIGLSILGNYLGKNVMTERPVRRNYGNSLTQTLEQPVKQDTTLSVERFFGVSKKQPSILKPNQESADEYFQKNSYFDLKVSDSQKKTALRKTCERKERKISEKVGQKSLICKAFMRSDDKATTNTTNTNDVCNEQSNIPEVLLDIEESTKGELVNKGQNSLQKIKVSKKHHQPKKYNSPSLLSNKVSLNLGNNTKTYEKACFKTWQTKIKNFCKNNHNATVLLPDQKTDKKICLDSLRTELQSKLKQSNDNPVLGHQKRRNSELAPPLKMFKSIKQFIGQNNTNKNQSLNNITFSSSQKNFIKSSNNKNSDPKRFIIKANSVETIVFASNC